MDEPDKSKRFEIIGVDDADKIRKNLWDIVNNKEKVNVNLLKDDDVQTIDADGKAIVAINVPRADYTIRPIYINGNLSKGTFKRNHEGDYHCSEQELKMMLRDANEAGNDRMILSIIQWMMSTSRPWSDIVSCSRQVIQTMFGMNLTIRNS